MDILDHLEDYLAPRYQHFEELTSGNRGAMGYVVAAVQSSRTVNRPVIIKLVKEELVSKIGPQAFAQFENEMRTLVHLSHPYIVPVIEFSELKLPAEPNGLSVPYLIMEYMPGGSLAERYLTATEVQKRQWIEQICKALTYMHGHGYLHLDLKPSNILLDESMNVRIADFGLAQLTPLEELTIKNSDITGGTPGYCAPEQLSDDPIGRYTDIFALGLLTWEIFTTCHPRPDETGQPTEQAPIILSDEMARCLQKAFAPDPTVRYQTVDQFWHALMQAYEAPTPGQSPYKGLEYFTEHDKGFFCGRETEIEDLVNRVNHDRFIVIRGASGSGKSSLVRAGLIPALKKMEEPRWQTSVFVPTIDQPLANLARAVNRWIEVEQNNGISLESLRQSSHALTTFMRGASIKYGQDQRFILIIDQFEELLLCPDKSEIMQFIQNITQASLDMHSSLTVVAVLRFDFVEMAESLSIQFAGLLSSNFDLRPLSSENLHRIITVPAEKGRWELEDRLVERILIDIGDDTGSLPLLSHALLETWKRRRSRTLTLQGYEATGGVRLAIRRTAETVYNEDLTPPLNNERIFTTSRQQQLARDIFLRLIRPQGNTVAATRSRIQISELIGQKDQPEEISDVINILASARLITVGANLQRPDEVEITHEALIQHWERLQNWISNYREWLGILHNVRDETQLWQTQRDTGRLFRGNRLQQVQEKISDQAFANRLNQLEWEFIKASIDAERRRKILERLALASLVILVFIASIAAIVAIARGQEIQLSANNLATQVAISGTSQSMAETNAHLAETRAIEALVQSDIAGTAAAVAVNAQETAVHNEGVALTREVEVIEALSAREEQRRLALIQSLISSSQTIYERENDTELATLLVMEAARLDQSFVQDSAWLIDDALRTLLINHPYFNTTLTGHLDGVYGVAFSPDGKWLASASDDFTIRLWDMTDPTVPPIILTDVRFAPTSLAFSPDGTLLAAGTADDEISTIRIWSMDDLNRRPLILYGHQDWVWAVAFSPDGRWLASASADHTIGLWDMENYSRPPLFLDAQTDFAREVAFSPDGDWLASGSDYGNVLLWRMDDLTEDPFVLTTEEGVGYSLDFSPDGKWIASGGVNGTIFLWDRSNPEAAPIVLRGHETAIYTLAFSPDGSQLASGDVRGELRLWDMDDFSSESVLLLGHIDGINSLAYSPDGSYLATGSLDQEIRLWSLKSSPAAPLMLNDNHTEHIGTVALSSDGSYLAGGSGDTKIRIWNMNRLSDPPIILSGHRDWINSVAFQPDGSLLASASSDNLVLVWNLEEIATQPVTLTGHTNIVGAVAFNNDGTLLASGGWDQRILLWNTGDFSAKPTVLLRHEAEVTSLAFSPSGNYLASGGWDESVVVWDLRRQPPEPVKIFSTPDGIYAVSFSPDGNWLAAGCDDHNIYLWPANDFDYFELEPVILRGHEYRVRSVAFSHDSATLASGSSDGTIRFWDVNRPTRPSVVIPGQSTNYSVVFSPDGNWLISGSNYYVQFNQTPGYLINTGCQMVRRNLTSAEWQQYLPGEIYKTTCSNLPAGITP